QNALAELLQALQFGGGFAALGTPPARHGRFFLRQWNRHRGTCHNCTFLSVVNETLRPWRARTAASLLPSKDLNNIINLDLKSSIFFSCSRGVPWTRGASKVARPVLAGAPGSSGVSTILLRKKLPPPPRPVAHLTNPCARPRATPGTCEIA